MNASYGTTSGFAPVKGQEMVVVNGGVARGPDGKTCTDHGLPGPIGTGTGGGGGGRGGGK